MKKFRIRGALGGGFGGCENQEWEYVKAENEDVAMDMAYEIACEEYDMYDGIHGLLSLEDIMDEYECDYEEAREIWQDERESWLDYEVEEVK